MVLVKYPVFVYLLGGPPERGQALPLFLAMTLVYFSFAVYEGLHDPRVLAAPEATRVLALEMAALTATSTLMAVSLLGGGAALALLEAAWVAAGGLTLMGLFARHRTHRDLGRWRYAVFILGFVQVLTLSLGSPT